MIWVYLAALVFGGVFVVPMLLGGLAVDADFGADFDGDVDLDIDSDFELDSDTDFGTDIEASGSFGSVGPLDALGDFVASLLSFRSTVFFLFFFGFSGALFNALGINGLSTLVSALALGLFASVLNTQLFRYLKKSASTSQRLNRDIEGHSAKVVLPIGVERKGRIRTDLGGRPTFMVALPFVGGGRFDVGDSVVVVEVRNGTAMVAGLELDTETAKENQQ